MANIPMLFQYTNIAGDSYETCLHRTRGSMNGYWHLAVSTYHLNEFMEKNPNITHLTFSDGPVSFDYNCTLRVTRSRNLQYSDCLQSIVLPSTLKSLPEHFCSGRNSLRGIAFPDGIETIPPFCCKSCDSLESVVLPKSLKEIGKNAFADCKNLKNVEFHGDPKSIEHLTCQDNIVKLRESNPALASMLENCKYVSDEENSKETRQTVIQNDVSESEKSSVYLKHISEKMIHFVHSDKTGKDYARVGVNLVLDGKQSVGNVLLPVDSVTDSEEKSSKYQRTKRMDVCLGEPDDRLKVSLGKNPNGTWKHKFMTVREIKTSNEEAMKAYRESKLAEYKSTVENSSSHERQNNEFGG